MHTNRFLSYPSPFFFFFRKSERENERERERERERYRSIGKWMKKVVGVWK
jgi:hypothetical protein